jgi:hypothetical protein
VHLRDLGEYGLHVGVLDRKRAHGQTGERDTSQRSLDELTAIEWMLWISHGFPPM